nr:hypothetical protein CFP56_25123 [Quercus suber]
MQNTECKFSSGEKSKEKEASFQQSTKKAKESLGAPKFNSPPSYRDKLVGEIPGAFAQAFNLGINDVDMLAPRQLWGNWLMEVQYEGINNLCFSCGRVGHRREGCPYTIKESKHDLEMDGKTNLSSGKEGNSEMEGDNSQEAGKTEDDLKDDGKDEYGPWLLVKRKKIGLRVGGPRNSNQGVGASLGKGAILSLEALTKQMKVSNDRPNHRVTSGLEEGYKKALHLLLR